ncbi:MAG: DEAD/DEAH box helicase [Nanoarchaeota archaeon]
MQYKSLTLDPFQEESIQAIEKGQSVVVSAPTGSGKTLIADYIINKDIHKGIRVIYTAPIKALSNQKYKEFSEEYGKEKIGLLTGDIVRNPEAPILIMTTEIYRNMALSRDPMMDKISYVIFDEIHYINDIERGYVWEESIIFSPEQVRFLCLSATIPNAQEFASWINAIKGHEVITVVHEKREVPLEINFYAKGTGIASLEDIREVINIPEYSRAMRSRARPPKSFMHLDLIRDIRNQVPCLFFCFSRKKCQDYALDLLKTNMFSHDPKRLTLARKKLQSASPDIRELSSTRTLLNVLPYGIAFHHAGLIPIQKEIVEELFGLGLINVLFTTETFAVGINMPAKTTCFDSLRKYDGISFRHIYAKEFFQIAGRAGRRGIDKKGFVYAMLEHRDFDYKLIKKLIGKDEDPIKSQFRLSVNTVLSMIRDHTQDEIDTILTHNFFTYQKFGNRFDKQKNVFGYSFDRIKKRLINLGYIKEGKLTAKGQFTAGIYADEILLGEIFATPFHQELNEYQILLLLACLCYEPRERDNLGKPQYTKDIRDLKRRIQGSQTLAREKKFAQLVPMTAFIHPCYHGKTIFDIVKGTDLLEGDLLRFFSQMLDRMNQVRKATTDRRLEQTMRSCKDIVLSCLNHIDVLEE